MARSEVNCTLLTQCHVTEHSSGHCVTVLRDVEVFEVFRNSKSVSI
jgi:hypothetical protein